MHNTCIYKINYGPLFNQLCALLWYTLNSKIPSPVMDLTGSTDLSEIYPREMTGFNHLAPYDSDTPTEEADSPRDIFPFSGMAKEFHETCRRLIDIGKKANLKIRFYHTIKGTKNNKIIISWSKQREDLSPMFDVKKTAIYADVEANIKFWEKSVTIGTGKSKVYFQDEANLITLSLSWTQN